MIVDHWEKYMQIALQEARRASERGDFPVGAVLTIDDVVRGRAGNFQTTKKSWSAHPEKLLIDTHAFEIQEESKRKNDIVLYTTLEPCLMCFGSAVMNRVSQIIYACPDPLVGVAKLNPRDLPEWYIDHLPQIERGPLGKESYELLTTYMSEHQGWETVLKHFETMGAPELLQHLV